MPDTKGLGTFVNDEHELATDAIDLFSVPHAEVSIVHGKNVTYYPTGPLTDDGNYEFIMTNDSNEYTVLDQTTIYGECEVVKVAAAGNEATKDADKLSCVNLFPQALFKQIEVYLNGQCINDLSTVTYPWKAFLENTLTYDDNMKKTTLAATEMYIKDTIGEETYSEANVIKNAFALRRAKIIGKRICFDIVPHIDFLQSKKFLIPGVEMRIKLIKSNDDFVLIHGQASNTYKVDMKKLQLCTRKVTLDPRVSAAIEKGLEKAPAIYPITQSKIKTHLLASGSTTYHLPQVIRGKLPRSFLFVILESDQMESSPSVNPFFFSPRGVNNINVYINGEPIHPVSLDPDYANGKYLKEYRWQLDNTGLKNNETNGITYEEYGKNMCFYAYDLSPDQCNGYYKHGLETGNIDITVGFAKALTKNHTLLLFACYNEQILIDKNRVITLIS